MLGQILKVLNVEKNEENTIYGWFDITQKLKIDQLLTYNSTD